MTQLLQLLEIHRQNLANFWSLKLLENCLNKDFLWSAISRTWTD